MEFTELTRLLENSITADDHEGFSTLLELLPLEVMDRRIINDLYGTLANRAASLQRAGFIEEIAQREKLVLAGLGTAPEVPMLISLFLTNTATIETLSWAVRQFPDMSLTEIIDILSQLPDEPLIRPATYKVLKVYRGHLSNGEEGYLEGFVPILRILLSISQSLQGSFVQDAVLEFLLEELKLSRNPEDFSVIPEWVFREEYLDTDEVEITLKTRLDANVDLANGFSRAELLERIPVEVALELRESSTEDIRQFATWYLIKSDEVIFQILGPLNPYPEIEESENFGVGCRMFRCVVNEEEDHWFDGVCDYCLFRIRLRQHTVRLPVYGGGWRGCYCSWRCAAAYLLDSGDDFTPEVKINMLLLSQKFASELYEVGIIEQYHKTSDYHEVDSTEDEFVDLQPEDIKGLIELLEDPMEEIRPD